MPRPGCLHLDGGAAAMLDKPGGSKDGTAHCGRDRRVAGAWPGDGAGAGARRVPGGRSRPYRERRRRDRARNRGTPLAERLQTLVADLRRAEECDRVVAAAETRLGKVDILVNNAGLTFTYIDPARFRRPAMQKFWQVGDEIVNNVIATNYLAADRLARRVAGGMVGARLGPHRQRHDQARHDEPRRDASLWRVQGGARNGERGLGQGRGGHRAHGQHRQPRRRRQHAGHGRGNARG